MIRFPNGGNQMEHPTPDSMYHLPISYSGIGDQNRILGPHSPPRKGFPDTFMPLSDFAKRAWYIGLNTLFPHPCTTCHAPLWDDPVPFFCQLCWKNIQPLSGPLCPRCGKPFPSRVTLLHSPTHECGTCRTRAPAFSKVWSVFPYAPPLKEAITLFKYQGKHSLAGPLAERMLEALPTLPPLDHFMAIPLHPHRLREREYNQALLLAYRLSRATHIPLLLNGVIRIRSTLPQTGLSKKARLTNVRRAFGVPKPNAVQGKRILLIDDVFTTGATLNECAKTLRRAGSGPVYGLTLTRMV